MPDRNAIAAALGTVPGLNASPVTPDVIDAGAAWPARISMSPISMHPETAYTERWAAFVALPAGNLASSMEVADEIYRTVCAALQAAQLRVDLIEPVNVQTGPNSAETVPALRFTLTD